MNYTIETISVYSFICISLFTLTILGAFSPEGPVKPYLSLKKIQLDSRASFKNDGCLSSRDHLSLSDRGI